VVPSLTAAEPTYWQDVRPLLRKHCTVCHRDKHLNEPEVSGGLALDTLEAVRTGAKTPVIAAGKSGDSELVKRLLTNDEKKRMPQDAPPLPPESIAVIRRWIDSGAKEGTKPDDASTTAGPVVTSSTRKLDVILPTNAVPPAGVLGPGAPAKLELVLKAGPLASVAAVAFSPDGKLLAVGYYGRVTVWDTATVQPVKTLTNVLGAVNALRFSPDGKLLAVAGGQPSAKGDLRLYSVEDWKLAGTLGGHTDVISSIAFSLDGKLLASASFDKTVHIWDVATHKPVQSFTGHSDFVYSVAFSPDGQWLASASKDRTVRLFETATGKSRLTLSGMEQEVLAVAISPDGKQVVSSGQESQLSWWNAQTGERTRRQGGHGIAVHEIWFSKDGQLVASAGADRTVRLWRGDNGTPVRTLAVGSVVYTTAISPNGKLIAAGSFDGLLRLFDAASGRHLLTLLSLPPTGEQGDWLALTPEGYTVNSEGLPGLGQWRMMGKETAAEKVWKALRQPEAVSKAWQGGTLPVPDFGK